MNFKTAGMSGSIFLLDNPIKNLDFTTYNDLKRFIQVVLFGF